MERKFLKSLGLEDETVSRIIEKKRNEWLERGVNGK